ncbi:hypothetical protein ACFQ51_46640 [Streptomyces kaempferi]
MTGIEKRLWYALRHSFAPRLATVQPVSPGLTHDPTGTAGLALTLVNDSAADWTSQVSVFRISLDCRELARTRLEVSWPPSGLLTLRLDPVVAAPTDPHSELLIVEADGARTTWAYRPDRTLTSPPPARTVTTSYADGALALTVPRSRCCATCASSRTGWPPRWASPRTP